MVLKVIIFAPPLKSFLMDLFTEWVYVDLFLESDNLNLWKLSGHLRLY